MPLTVIPIINCKNEKVIPPKRAFFYVLTFMNCFRRRKGKRSAIPRCPPALSPTRGFWPPDAPGSAAFVPGSLRTLRVRGAPKTHAYWVACLPPPGLLTSESVPISICTNLCSIGIGGRGGPPPSLGARDGSSCLRPATPHGGRPQPPGGTAFPRFCLRTGVRGIGRKTHERETEL